MDCEFHWVNFITQSDKLFKSKYNLYTYFLKCTYVLSSQWTLMIMTMYKIACMLLHISAFVVNIQVLPLHNMLVTIAPLHDMDSQLECTICDFNSALGLRPHENQFLRIIKLADIHIFFICINLLEWHKVTSFLEE